MRIVVILACMFFSSCVTLIHENNKKFRVSHLAKDGYKNFLHNESIVFEKYIDDTINSNFVLNEIKINEISKLEINKILLINKDLTVLFWHDCPDVTPSILNLAKRFKTSNIQFIIVSTDYLIGKKINNLKLYNLSLPIYILSNNDYGDKKMLKQINYFKNHDKDTYAKFKDDIHMFYVAKYKNGFLNKLYKIQDINSKIKQNIVLEELQN